MENSNPSIVQHTSGKINVAKNMFDSVLEGIQIIDFEWCYIYLNRNIIVQAKKPNADFLGFTIMES